MDTPHSGGRHEFAFCQVSAGVRRLCPVHGRVWSIHSLLREQSFSLHGGQNNGLHVRLTWTSASFRIRPHFIPVWVSPKGTVPFVLGQYYTSSSAKDEEQGSFLMDEEANDVEDGLFCWQVTSLPWRPRERFPLDLIAFP